MINTVNGRASGNASIGTTILSIFTTLILLIGMLGFPVLTMRWEKNRKKKHEEKRQTRYKEYLKQKNAQINEIKQKQKSILYKNYSDTEDCVEIIMQKQPKLWKRKIDSFDFLSVRIGIGNVPLNINVQYPEERFTMEDDNLTDLLKEIADNSKMIDSAPFIVSLAEKNITSIIVKDQKILEKFIQNLIIQLIAFQSYEDLKLVFLIGNENERFLEYVKMLPHVWSNIKDIRFYAENYNEMQEISKYLEEELKTRANYIDRYSDYKSFSPYYLVITDDYRKVQNLKIIEKIRNLKVNLGFSLLCITDNFSQLPNESKAFINIDGENAIYFENEISDEEEINIKLDLSVTVFFEKICYEISNIPIKSTQKNEMLLPASYSFLEMYEVRKNRTVKHFRKME